MCFGFDTSFSHIAILCILAFTVFSTFLVAPLPSYSQPPTIQDSPVVEIPYSDWYYRWGKSPVDDGGMPLWIYEDVSSPGWQLLTSNTSKLKNPNNDHFLWLMIPVPDGHWKHPALSLPSVPQNLEIYHSHQRVYRSGEFKSARSNKHWIVRSHLVSLENMEAETGSDLLFLRIFSDSQYIGIKGDRIRMGSMVDLVKIMVRLEIDSFILGPIFSFAGLFAVFIFLRRKKQKLYIVLFFGAFAIFTGINELVANPIIQVSTWAIGVRYHLAMLSTVLWPIGLYLFIEQVLGRGYKSLIRRIWQAHIIFAVGIILIDAINILSPMPLMRMLFGLLTIGILIGMPTAIIAAIKGSFEAKILNAGLAIMMLSGIHDILAEFGKIPYWTEFFPWAILVFILLLAYILEHRFTRAHSQLEEYSLTLEQKVEERTQQLSDKNEALEQALQQLKETQDQLIMKEKMASLGDLVAGVAHEMNNPIGVIQSTADIANRCIRKIKDLFQRSQNSDESGNTEEQLQQSLKLLETSHDTIITASERTAKIVRSLRTFASLDEALFQRVNIHENIDTTLALVYHELRNKATVIKQYGEIPRIQCYPNELNQAFMNLLRNAGQAIEQQGTITITTSADEAQIYIKISDTGKGIPIEDRPKIFDPGFTTQGVGVGKGLGLSIVYNIVQKHHGSIDVNSEAGKGTEISITLPIEQPSE